jgi:hypothetical protein
MSEHNHKATLSKFERAYERDKAKAEALEEKMKEGLANALKKEENQKGLQKQFADDLERMRSDPMGAPRQKNIRGFADDLEPDPTGYEKYPWQEDEEDE